MLENMFYSAMENVTPFFHGYIPHIFKLCFQLCYTVTMYIALRSTCYLVAFEFELVCIPSPKPLVRLTKGSAIC